MAANADILGPIGPLADHARAYAQAGLEVFPCNPRDKRPLTSQHNATVDVDQVTAWWTRRPDALIGHRLPADQLILDIDPRHGGRDTWAALKAEIGALPTTRAHASGRGDGGGHTWWEHPGTQLRIAPLNAWARERGVGHAVTTPDGEPTGRWTAGIDLLHHDHRYTILPPSPHPDTGQPYQWLGGHGLQTPPAPLPALLAELLTAPAPAPQPPVRDDLLADVDAGDSIADWYSAHHPFSRLLPAHGWRLVEGDGDSDSSKWRHPQATTAVSATVRHGCLFVYSPNTVFEPTEHGDVHGYTPFRAYTLLEHHGDGSAAARAARETKDGPRQPRHDPADLLGDQPADPQPAGQDQADPEQAPGSSWQRTDLAALVDGITRGDLRTPAPTLGLFVDGSSALWYPGRVNGLYGEPGKGKTWIALCVAAEQLAAGRTVAWIDLEEPAQGIVTRLLDLGVDPQAIVERFAHFAPEETIRLSRAMADELARIRPSFVAIDSTGEALALEGAGPNNDDEVATWFRTWPRQIATATGAGVVVIDHVIKDERGRGLWPGGSQRKKAAINGSAFMAEPLVELGRGVTGRLKLTTSKDRQGHHRGGTRAAEFVLDATGKNLHWHLEGPRRSPDGQPAPFRPTVLMERVSRALETAGQPLSKRRLADAVKAKHEHRNLALQTLQDEGYVTVEIRDREHWCTVVKPYREADDILPTAQQEGTETQ